MNFIEYIEGVHIDLSNEEATLLWALMGGIGHKELDVIFGKDVLDYNGKNQYRADITSKLYDGLYNKAADWEGSHSDVRMRSSHILKKWLGQSQRYRVEDTTADGFTDPLYAVVDSTDGRLLGIFMSEYAANERAEQANRPFAS